MNRQLQRWTVGFCLGAGTPLLWAQAAVDRERRATMIEEVVVTAQRREERLQEAPIAITAFSSAALEAYGADNMLDISEFTPNFTAVNTTSSNHNIAASIRGIASSEPALAQDPKVGFYLDGVYLAKNSGAVFDVGELQRIEVLRGPQGTLYGKNTTGGAINLITAKPSGEFGLRQQLTFGNRGRMIAKTGLDLPAIGSVAARLSYLKSEHDGLAGNHNPNTAVRAFGTEDTEAYRIALRWQPSDGFTADYAYDRTDAESVAKAQQLSHVNPAYANAVVVTSLDPFIVQPVNPFQQILDAGAVSGKRRLGSFSLDAVQPEHVTLEGHNLTLSLLLDDIELRSITGYREYRSVAKPGLRGASDFDGGDWAEPIFHLGTPASNGVRKRQKQFSQEFQLIGNLLDERLLYTAGVYYFEEDGRESSNQWNALIFLPAGTIPGLDFDGLYRQELILGPPPGGLGESYSIDNESWAVYGQATYIPLWLERRLSVTLGLRYTEDKRSARILDATPNWAASEKWSNLTPSLTLEYTLNDSVNAYAKVSSGYNAGSYPVRASSQEAFNLTVDEETVTSFELGLKSDWLDRRLRFNAAAFLYDYDDLQVSDFQAGSTILVNAGKARISGFEFELTAIPWPGLTASLNYGYLDYEYREFEVGGVDVSDQARPPYAPRHTASGSLEYQFDPWAFGQWVLRADVSHTSGYHFDPFNFQYDAADERTLLNGRIALRDMPLAAGRLQLALWGKNLTNEAYRDFGVDFGDLGFAVNTWGELRSYGIDIIYEY